MSSPRRTRRSTPSEEDLFVDDAPEIDSKECSSKSKSRSSHHAGGSAPGERGALCSGVGGLEESWWNREADSSEEEDEDMAEQGGQAEQHKVGKIESNVASI